MGFLINLFIVFPLTVFSTLLGGVIKPSFNGGVEKRKDGGED